MTRRWTIGILIGVTLALIAWDVYAYVTAGGPATISDVTLDFARQHPVLPFAIGVVCGHALWGQRIRE